MQRDRLSARGLDISPYALSHLAVRVADRDLYVHQRTLLERHASTNREVWNGLDRARRAARCPRWDPVSRIELIPPVHQRVYRMGLEHLGVVVGEQFDDFSRVHRAALTGQQFQSRNVQPVYVLFEDFTHVKFYRRSFFDVGCCRSPRTLVGQRQDRQIVEEGHPAPGFTLSSDTGDRVSLDDFRGKPVVLYFYPKDDTPGCTTQACGIRDEWGEFEERGAVVLGVSPDSETSHVKFKRKYGLPFTLLADEDHAVSDAYGVWVEKSMAGRTYMGVERSTFVIDADGNVAKVMRKVKPDTHAGDVLAALPA